MDGGPLGVLMDGMRETVERLEAERRTLVALQLMDAQVPLFVRVLRALETADCDCGRTLRCAGNGLSGRQVAALLDVAPGTAIGCLDSMLQVGAVTKVRHGRADVWQLTTPARSFLRARGR